MAPLHRDTESETSVLAGPAAPSGLFNSVSQESDLARDSGSAPGRGSQTAARGMPHCSISTGSCVAEAGSNGKRLEMLVHSSPSREGGQ